MNLMLGVAFLLSLSTAALSAATSEDVVRKLYKDFNSHNADTLVSNVSDDVRWMTIAGEKILVETSGREALRASMGRYFRSTPTVESRIESLMSAGDFVTVHERVTWRQGSTQKTQSALAVYKLRDSQIVAVWYYDVMP
jgi:hypothetical protein